MPHHNCVSLVPLFSQLTESEQATIESIVHRHHYQAGETIFAAGDPMDALMIVASGQVKVFQLAANGKEQLLYLLTTGDFDGETALFSQANHNSFAQALMPTQICQINRPEFQRLMQKYPTISLNLLNEFGKRLTDLEKRTTKTATTSVESRLADYLVETAAQFESQNFKLPLKKKDLATYLGTTPETISRKLAELEQRGIITQTGSKQIQINDESALELL
ncbi:Crp/Fnr family transcriptional regulator [Paucilactobacillus vaccinostercus]|jgi:CRP/FNR family transcriptional regulator|uniref:Crp/Fnr family transcriptional regulator n=1 Tax=Paucilactobacillus vaccinostercus TaxID=176291 RepID=UPI00070BAB13|nr:Crp/Fnr family transcriptional regulator [Paucilactobacillus vaccinostercus]